MMIQPKILAIGGAGIKIASRLKEQGLIPNDILGIDLASQPSSFEILSIGNLGLELLGSGGDPEVAARAFESKKALIEEKLKSCEWVVILSGLGGGTASALASLTLPNLPNSCGGRATTAWTMPGRFTSIP